MKRVATWAAVVLLAGMAGGRAEAGLIITISQSGGNVVASSTGSLVTDGLNLFSSAGGTFTSLDPAGANIATGPATSPPPSAAVYGAYFSGPSAFGTGGLVYADLGTGQVAAFTGPGTGFLAVSAGYASGSPILDSTGTFLNQTVAGLGLVAGTYNYTYSADRGGAAIDSITVQVGPASVPEPASLAMLGLGVASAGVVARMRRRTCPACLAA